MSLVKKPEMTEKKVAANRRNQNLCNGPVVDERREHIHAALRRFGYNVQAEEVAMRALGEDPADFQELLEALWEEWNPVGSVQEGVVIRLARAMWLMNRADRAQEGAALRRAQSADRGRDNRLHAQMMRLKMTMETLRSLARPVAEWHYVTTREDLDVMKKLHQQGVMTEMGEIALDLFFYLQEPGANEEGASEEEQYRAAARSFRSIFGLEDIKEPVKMLNGKGEYVVIRPEGWVEPEASPDAEEDEDSDKDDRYPKIALEDWKPRERARRLLKNILSRQAEACEDQRKALLKESLAGPSPYEFAAEVAPSHADALMMRRTQDANMREVRRLIYLLLMIKRYQRQTEALEKTAALHDVSETKWVSSLATECPEPLSNSN